MKSKWSINSFLKRDTLSQLQPPPTNAFSTSRHYDHHYAQHRTEMPLSKPPHKEITSNKNISLDQMVPRNCRHNASVLETHPIATNPTSRPASHLATISSYNSNKIAITKPEQSNSYNHVVKEKDKKIEALIKENSKLSEQNKKLIAERSEANKLLQEFAHSMGSIIQSLYLKTDGKLIKETQKHRPDNLSFSTSSTDVAQAEKILKDLNLVASKTGKCKNNTVHKKQNEFTSGRKSLTEILLESSQTAAMVQCALNEMQDLVD